MKISMIDKVLATGIVLAVCGASLKAALSMDKKSVMEQKMQVEEAVIQKGDKQKKIDYNQIRKDYQWDLEGAGDLGETFRSWD